MMNRSVVWLFFCMAELEIAVVKNMDILVIEDDGR